MPDLSTWIAFAVASLALNLTPGPDMTYVIGRSLGQGSRAGMISALGISAGTLVHMLAAALGVGAVLRVWPIAYDMVRYAGAAYLMILGVRMLRKGWAENRAAGLDPEPLWAIFRQGVLTNVLNPKVALFFVAFLPQFVVPAKASIAWQILALGIYFNFSGTVVNLFVARLASAAGDLLRRGRAGALVEKISGCICIALGWRVVLAKSS